MYFINIHKNFGFFSGLVFFFFQTRGNNSSQVCLGGSSVVQSFSRSRPNTKQHKYWVDKKICTQTKSIIILAPNLVWTKRLRWRIGGEEVYYRVYMFGWWKVAESIWSQEKKTTKKKKKVGEEPWTRTSWRSGEPLEFHLNKNMLLHKGDKVLQS